MTFLAPYWLFAASAILIPIAIHLWNKRQGKTVKVGSIRWLEASASKQWSQIRLTDIGLLLLRCLIIITLSVALAKPVLEAVPAKVKGSKAVFISPELLYSKAITTLKPTIDTLLLHGYTLHSYTPAFDILTQEQWQQLSTNLSDSTVENGNYWQLLAALAQKYPHAQDSVWLFTSDQQRHFAGEPTPLQENINWVPVALEATTTWLQAAYTSGPDSIHFIVGHSSRESTSYSRHGTSATIGSKNIDGLPVKLEQQNDSLWARWGDQTRHRILVEQQPLHVTLVASGKQQAEVKYLQAALEAISNYTRVPLKISKGGPIDAETKWLFWLSDAAVPDSVLDLVNNGMQLWVQPGTKPKATKTGLLTSGTTIRLHQLSEPATEQGQVIWSAKNGEPVLTSTLTGKGNVYYFRSGFAPAWSRLGQSPQLPELLIPLLLPAQETAKYDARALPDALLQPARQAVKSGQVQQEQEQALLPLLVAIAFMLFLLERFITSKRVKV